MSVMSHEGLNCPGGPALQRVIKYPQFLKEILHSLSSVVIACAKFQDQCLTLNLIESYLFYIQR